MVHRAKKDKNFTIMSNYHLRDARLSLKARGLLSQMLSLPDDWNYTARGLAAINKENYHTIRGVIGELEDMGYIVRRQRRGKFGEWMRMEYDIYEIPLSPDTEEGSKEASDADAEEDAPEMEVPPPFAEVSPREAEVPPPRERTRTDTTALDVEALNEYRRELRENVDFEWLWREHGADIDEIAGLVEIMAEVCAGAAPIRVHGQDVSAKDAKERFLTLTRDHILYVMECMSVKREIRDIRAYTLSALYNAPKTIEIYYREKAGIKYESED